MTSRVLAPDYRAGNDPIPDAVRTFARIELPEELSVSVPPSIRGSVRFAGLGTVAQQLIESAGFTALMDAAGVSVSTTGPLGDPQALLLEPTWDVALVFSPWKEAVAALTAELTPAAQATMAVDTLVRVGGPPHTVGINTTCWAVQTALEASCAGTVPPSALILGAGASARSAARAVRQAWGTQIELSVAARNVSAAAEVGRQFDARVVEPAGLAADPPVALVVNATTWGETAASEAVPFAFPIDAVFRRGQRFLDLNTRASWLQLRALELGATVTSGKVTREVNNACRAALASSLS